MNTDIEVLIELDLNDQSSFLLKKETRKLNEKIALEQEPIEKLGADLLSIKENKAALEKNKLVSKERLAQHDEFIAKLEKVVPLIKNQKEFVASKKQLEEARKKRSEEEETCIALDLKIEEDSAKLEAIQQLFEETSEKTESVLKEIHKKVKKFATKLENTNKDKAKILPKLGKNLSRYYLRSTERGMFPIITSISLRDKTCGGCNMVIQPQVVNDLISNPTSYTNCPHCARVIYIKDEPIVEEVVEEAPKAKASDA